jgi:hypothetical protein
MEERSAWSQCHSKDNQIEILGVEFRWNSGGVTDWDKAFNGPLSLRNDALIDRQAAQGVCRCPAMFFSRVAGTSFRLCSFVRLMMMSMILMAGCYFFEMQSADVPSPK